MAEILAAFRQALALVAGLDPDLVEIVALSLRVTGTALLLSSFLGLPVGAALAVARFPGRHAVIAVLNALMGLPPVVAGLLVYLVLSREGPLGGLELLFTPAAMVIVQVVLVTPIVAALSRQVLEDLWAEYDETLRSLGARRVGAVATLIFEARHRLATTLLAGFGRAIGEVGAVMIVGGNIAHFTRVMTTAIVLETSRGDLARALALGIVLLAIALAVNAAAQVVQEAARRAAA